MEYIKDKLKAAREAIKNKNYETSLNLSKEILKEDKENYMALIYLGLSSQQVGHSEQARKAFRKAIEISPSKPLAWNGLINYYEEIDSVDAKQELIKLYTSAVFLEGMDKKLIDYCEKLAQLWKYGDIKDIAQTIFKCRRNNVSYECSIYKILVNLLQQVDVFPSELNCMYEECLSNVVEQEKSNPEYYSKYLGLLYKKEKYNDLLFHAEKMYNLFTTEMVSLVWICKVFNQLFVEEHEQADIFLNKVVQYYPKLLQVEPQNAIGLFTKSIVLLKENELLKGKDTLIEVVSLRPGLLHSWFLLTNVNINLNLWEEAMESSQFARSLLESSNNSNKILNEKLNVLTIKLLSISSEEEHWKEALELYKKIESSEEKEKCGEFVIRANINLCNFGEANLLISELKSSEEATSRLLLAQLLHKQKKYQEALDILENDPVNESDWWIEIGQLYWNMGKYKKCLVPYLTAARCNPNNFLTFVHLGNYYKKFDCLDKARRCYEKALKINSKSAEIGTELCKIYRKLKNWEATHNFLQNITSGIITTKNSWAWLQLGLSYLEQEDYSNAIDNLRSVVRVQPTNVHCWEALADAYLIRGSYTTAQRCYEKALQLVDNTLYPLFQIANIKKILGHFPEALLIFEEILASNKHYVPALKAYSETCMYQAKECYKDQRLGTARNYMQRASEKLVQAIQERGDLCCLWKLFADICLFVVKLPDKYCYIFVPNSFLEDKELEGTRIAERDDLYNMATRSYCKAIVSVEDNTSIWHDLALCYLHHALSVEDERRVRLFSYSMAASQYCVFTSPSNWQHWNLLGIIAMKKSPPDYALAQHAFINAVTINHNNAVCWVNLGVLYYLMDDIKLANKAFAQGQRSDPNYVNSWVGQALIAEIMGHEEAMDLFRHSTQLGQHQQGGFGYGHFVCKFLLAPNSNANIYSIHNMHAIPVAWDALTWYTEKNPVDGCAWNMLGILSERMGLMETSLTSYKKAYILSEKEYRDLAATNYGRILVKLEKYSEAIKMFQNVEEATFNSGCGLALALFKDKQYAESYDAYEQVLHWLTEEQSSQSDLLVALASIAYMFQGPDAAKTLLFQSIELKPPSPWSLYATLSLALLHKDLKLAKLVSKELEVLRNSEDCLKYYALMKSYTYLLQGNHDGAVNVTSEVVHRYPNNSSVWLTLCLLLLRTSGQEKTTYTIATKCARAAMTLKQNNVDMIEVSYIVSLGLLLIGDDHDAYISTQKAVHCYPNVAENWVMLMSSLLNIKKIHPLNSLMTKMYLHVERLNPSLTLLQWIRKYKSYFVE